MDILGLQERKEILTQLRALNVASVVVDYDGSGDSGQVESVEARTAGGNAIDLAVPAGMKEVEEGHYVVGQGFLTQKKIKPVLLRERIEDFAYAWLEDQHPGWEINGGSYGQLTISVATGEFKFGHHIRVVSSEYDEYILPVEEENE